MPYDTLEYSGTEKQFADWGFEIDSISGIKRANGQDTFRATIVTASIAAEADAPTFAFEGRIIVRVNRASTTGNPGSFSGGLTKFIGKRTGVPMRAAASGQGVTYQFEGPSYDLRNCDYQQRFAGATTDFFLPETVLNLSTFNVGSGTLQVSVGDQIQMILQWMLDQYAAQGMAAPFQYRGRTLNAGTIDHSANSTTGTPGGNFRFDGKQFNYAILSTPSIDTTLFAFFLPTFIQKPMKCWSAIQKCLELSPRINTWFDYSVNPPMIRFDLVDSMAPMSLPLFNDADYGGGVSHKEISITPRDDLKVRAVVITYRITATTSGTTRINYAVDKWSGNGAVGALPGASNVNLTGAGDNVNDPNCGLRVITELIDLQGFSSSSVKGHMDVELLALRGGTQATKRAWWQSKRGGEVAKFEDSRVRFQDKNGTQTTIPDAKLYYSTAGFDSLGVAVAADQEFTAADYAFYNYRLVRGTFHAWFKQGSTSIQTVKCKAIAQMTFATYDAKSSAGTPDTDRAGNLMHKANQSDHHVNLELTNAVPDSGTSGYATFSTLASATAGEGYIIGAGGIAQYLYTHLNARQWEGDYVCVNANFVDASHAQYVTLGKSLNLTGGAAAWTAMNAQIQEIEEEYGTHRTSVKIGVSRILSAGNLAALFNMWRFRRAWYNTALRADSTQGGSGEVDQSKAAGVANTTHGVENPGTLIAHDYSADPSGTTPGTVNSKINIDPVQAGQNAGLNLNI